ncbi:MAG: hypothetical protein RQ758_03505 [Methanomicrobiaceae archaeon]|nr:hypothetical protein [Methanomicrobiaceae archaeon]
MTRRAGLVWDCSLLFNRYLEDCGVACELVTPHMLAAPFFRAKFVSLIVPTGFANPKFSGLLPALRASSPRIRRFVEQGGRLLVFGAMDPSPASYDWLPFRLNYRHEYFRTRVTFENVPSPCTILDQFSGDEVECDGYFEDVEGLVAARGEEGRALMVCHPLGEGVIVVTSFHEYPSRPFVQEFCTADRETLF